MKLDTIKLKGVVMEDFLNYKVPSLFLITTTCNWKCCIEGNFDVKVCQNSSLANSEIREYKIESIYNAYVSNPISKAIVFGGLEPFLQFDEVCAFIDYFRNHGCMDDIVIYTGYYDYELTEQIALLHTYGNIVVKFGRYIPNKVSHYDDVLGVNLASENQVAKKI